MEFTQIKKNLSNQIDRQLTSLITSDYVLWGLPNYRNEGDVMIWQGTLDFLETIPHRCTDAQFYDEYRFIPLPKDTVILIMGGGYFGDLWRKAWEYVVNTICQYPDNPIVILPQSIHYQSEETLFSDKELLSRCRHLTICVRDMNSFVFAHEHFRSHQVLLVPDMAFHINDSKWRRKPGKGILYLKREDKEFVPMQDQSISKTADLVSDWPSIKGYRTLDFCCFVYSKLRRFWSRPIIHHLSVLWMNRTYRPLMIRHAVEFINPFEEIHTTRLHAMILSLMMDKKVHYLDNVYGKLSSLHHTWLRDCDNLDIIE